MTKKNYNYGKLVDGKLIYAPNRLVVDVETETGKTISAQVFNGSVEQYESAGYLPVERDSYPEDGNVYHERYEADNGVIYVRWQQIIIPDYPSIEEQVAANSAAIIEIAAEIWGN